MRSAQVDRAFRIPPPVGGLQARSGCRSCCIVAASQRPRSACQARWLAAPVPRQSAPRHVGNSNTRRSPPVQYATLVATSLKHRDAVAAFHQASPHTSRSNSAGIWTKTSPVARVLRFPATTPCGGSLVLRLPNSKDRMPQLTDRGVLEPPDVTIRRIPRLCSRAFRLGGDRQDRARTSDFLADGGCVASGRPAVGML